MKKLTIEEILKYNLHTVKLKLCSSGETTEGKIVTYNNGIYFVHNNPRHDGGRPKEMFGYKYAWCMGATDNKELSYDISLIEDIEGPAPTPPAPDKTPVEELVPFKKALSLQEERAKLVARIAEIDEALEEDREEDYPEELF